MVAAMANSLRTMQQEQQQQREPDTQPDNASELADAVEWLKKAGVVHENKKPTFGKFFDEVVNIDIEDDDEG